MSSNSQMLKGLLEGCILQIVFREETYGYKICEELIKGGFASVNEGTVYPILIRLEKKKFIYSEKKTSPLGPKRKYYYLTEIGKVYLSQFINDWHNIKDNVDYFFSNIN